MAEYNIYAQERVNISSETVNVTVGSGILNVTGSELHTGNLSLLGDLVLTGNMTINTQHVLPNAQTTGTLTGAPTVDTGTIATSQTRGVAANPVITYVVDAAQAGIPQKTKVRIPAFQVLTITGSPTRVQFAGSLPTNPGISAVNYLVEILNNGARATGVLVIDPSGNISLSTLAGTAFTVVFGLAQDVVVDFISVAV